MPTSESSPGAAAVGPVLHAVCIALLTDAAVSLDGADCWAAFVNLGLWEEGLGTSAAPEAAGRASGAVLVTTAATRSSA